MLNAYRCPSTNFTAICEDLDQFWSKLAEDWRPPQQQALADHEETELVWGERDLMMIDPTEESVDNPGSPNFASPVPCNNHCQQWPPMKHPTALPLQERAWTYGCLTQFLKEGKKKIIKNKQLFQIETTLQRFPPVLSLLYGMTSANLNTRAKTLRVHAIPFMDPKEILI